MRETTLIAEEACTEDRCANPAATVMIIIRDQYGIEETVSACHEHRDQIGADRNIELVTMPLTLA